MTPNHREGRFGPWWQAGIWALILFKCWLVMGQPFSAIGPAPHDDWLFLSQAEHLLRGEWLGPYSVLTLSKGPFLSMFLATAFVANVPFYLAKAMLYSAGCLLVIVALRPLVTNRAIRFGLFAVLLFNPVTYDDHEYTRVLRQSLVTGMALMILAGLIGLYARRERPLSRQSPWAGLLGVTLAAFWLTREDSVWILPLLVPVWAYLVWVNIQSPKSKVQSLKSEVQGPESEGQRSEVGSQKAEDGGRRVASGDVSGEVQNSGSKMEDGANAENQPPSSILHPPSATLRPGWTARVAVILLLPLCLWAAGLGIVSYQNWRHYGVWTTCELKQASFKSAYGSLLRVKHQWEIPYVPVPRETRERIYQVSPAFAELRPFLEGDLGAAWANIAVPITGIPAEQREITSGLFVWALRDAVAAAGRARTAVEAAAYYERLTREVNDACDRGLLAAGAKRSGFLPPWRWSQSVAVLASMLDGVRHYYLFTGLQVVENLPSSGTPEDRLRFAVLTQARLAPPQGGEPIPTLQAKWDRRRIGMLEQIRRGYRAVMPWTGAAAMIALTVAFVLAVRRRRLPFFLVVSAGSIASLLALIAMLALMDVICSCPIEDCLYLMGGYGVWVLAQFSSFLALREVGNGGQSALPVKDELSAPTAQSQETV